MNLKLSIKNLKLIKDLELELSGSNVYVVSGQNEVGKSTVLQAISSLFKAKNDTPIPVSHDKEEATVIGIIETADGGTYSITMEAKKDGKIKFTMVSEKGVKTNSVTTIREVFQYQDFTAEEFVAWGSTADGRKKQTEIFLKCLEQSAQKLYNELSEKEKIAFDRRTPLISNILHYKKKISDLNMTDEELQLMEEDIEAISEEITVTKHEYLSISTSEAQRKALMDQMIEVDNSYLVIKESYEEQLISIDQQINNLKELKLQKSDELDGLTQRYDKKVQEIDDAIEKMGEPLPTDIITDKYNQAIEMEKMIASVQYKYEDFSNTGKLLNAIEQEKSDLDIEVEDYRQQKKLLIKNNPILKDIQIEDDAIVVVQGEQLLPLHDNQISQSRQMLIAARILLKLNPKLPILLVGRGESFDKNKMHELVQLAEENNAIIMIEKVIDQGALRIDALIEE
ncbi:MAG: AAA family ATPase [Bacteroidales bacterium]|jgi:energy-coupling factor transporter ATP-binding protein EcfA2